MEEQRSFIGCAGWSIPTTERTLFPGLGSQLERYAAQFRAVEVNTSFYRSHRGGTYARWAASAGDRFRFSVKMPREITHDSRFHPDRLVVERFVTEIKNLGTGLGCVLVQFPPSLQWEGRAARDFFEMLREQIDVPIACEPRHKSWFTDEVEAALSKLRISRVAADPCRAPSGGQPGGWISFVYYRLHGSPRVYYSTYQADYLIRLAEQIRIHVEAGKTCWCIFDNTAAGAAQRNALELLSQVNGSPAAPEPSHR